MELEIEKNATDKRLYRYDESEPKEKREYRHKKIKDDIEKRLKDFHKYVGLDINNPVERIDINVVLNTLETIKNMLIKKEIMTAEGFNDMYLITADNSLKILEVDKDKIKDNIKNQRMNSILRQNITAGKMMGPKVIRN
jgi:hypothetical protein